MQLTATVEDLLSWDLCDDWREEMIRAIAGEKIEWTALEILALDGVSAADKLWIVLRSELIPEPMLHELACRFAEAALIAECAAREPDPRSWAAIKAKRAWLRGEIDDTGLGAAQKAAWAAMRELADRRAMREVDVASAAACAAEAVVYAAAWEAAWVVALWSREAAAEEWSREAAAEEAERQVQMVREILLD